MATLFNQDNTLFSYFCLDGSYGDAEGMVVTDTSEWTNEEWTMIHEASDYDRAYIAYCFEKGRSVEDVKALLDDDEGMFRPAP